MRIYTGAVHLGVSTMKWLRSFLYGLMILALPFIVTEKATGQCIHTIRLYDSWGDGWSGNTIDVYVNNTLVLNDITLISGGGPEDYTFTASDFDTIRAINFGGGSFLSECYFDILAGDDSLIVDNWYPNSSGDFIDSGYCPICPSPGDLSAGSITDTQAVLSWTPYGSAIQWDIELGIDGFLPTGTPTQAGVTNPYTYTGLTMSTDYDYYVRSDCGAGDQSKWAGPYSFKTQCVAITVPHYEDFESFPTVYGFSEYKCWMGIGPGNNDIDVVTGSNLDIGMPTSGSIAFELNDGNISAYDTSVLVTPELAGLANGDKQIRFQVAAENVGCELYIGVLDNNQSTASLTILDTVLFSTYNVFEEYTLELTNTGAIGSGKHIAFVHGPSAYEIGLDDFIYEMIPACTNPSDLTVNFVNSIQAELDWTENGTATLWDIKIDTAGFNPEESTIISGITKPYTATGLIENSKYEFYIRTQCDGGGFSNWVGPCKFSTLCSTPSTVTYYQDFESFTPQYGLNYDNCWAGIGPGANDIHVVEAIDLDVGSPTSGLLAIEMNDGRIDIGDTAVLVSPELSGLADGDKEINFQVAAEATTCELYIGVLDNNTSTASLQILDTVNFKSTYTFKKYTYYLTNTAAIGSAKHIALVYGGLGNEIGIDDFRYETMPSCPMPSDLKVRTTTSSTAMLQWEESGSATQWDIEIGISGFLPTGSPTKTVNSNPYSYQSLPSNTDFDFYVRAVCGGGDYSEWVGPQSFYTVCDAKSVPYNEDFEQFNYVNGFIYDECWYGVGPGANDIDIVSFLDMGSPPSGSVAVELNDGYFSSGDTAAFVSPELIGLTDGNKQIRFKVGAESIFCELYVGVIENSSSLASLSILDTVTFAQIDTFYEYTLPLLNTGLLGNAKHIAFIHGSSNSEIGIDDFKYEIYPSCPNPSDLTATQVSSTEQQLGWTENGSSTAYDIELGETGFMPSQTPTVSDVGNPYTYTGLSMGKTYDFYVRASCNGSGSSNWVGPFTFTTMCGTYAAPYYEDFEQMTTQSGFTATNCWAGIGPGANDIDIVNAGSLDMGSPTSGNIAVELNDGDFAMGDTAVLVTPELLGLADGDKQIRFQVGAESTLCELYIGVLDNKQSTASLNILDTVEFTTMHNFSEYVYEFTNTAAIGTANHIALVHGNTSYEIGVDDFRYEVIPACANPTGLTVDSITLNSAKLTWNENGTATQWDIEVVEQGNSPTYTATATANDTTYKYTGLTQSKQYNYFVRSQCGGGGNSSWEGPCTFSTLCGVHAVPYTQNFDEWNIQFGFVTDDCWSGIGPGANDIHIVDAGNLNVGSPTSGTNAVELNDGNINFGDTAMLVSPEFSDLASGDKYISFQVAATSSSCKLYVGVLDNNQSTASFRVLDSVTFVFANTFKEYKLNLNNTGIIGDAKYVALMHGPTSYEIGVDDFKIDEKAAPPPDAVDEESLISGLSVYPNPNKGQFIVDMKLLEAQDIKVTVISGIGQVIDELEFANTKELHQSIDMGSGSEGLYYLRIIAGDEVFTRKVIVVR